jgi:hypothetical protein
MTIYQMRHAILEKHVGKVITPAQLKAELLEEFSGVKPQSVNASDCHYSDRKRAGSTCPECRKLGGFAVNRDGVVDMGASGWGNILAVYVPAGNTRSSVLASGGIAEAPRGIRMSDPLVGFDWRTVHALYDVTCRGFKSNSKHLRGFYLGATNDRFLYHKLVATAVSEVRSRLDADWYEALLYWKLYSQPAPLSKITEWRQSLAPGLLGDFLAKLPTTIPRKVQDVVDLVELVDTFQFPGMKSCTALPVRTTLLHILYPNTVPIFDKMVLNAVGAWRKGASQRISVLRQYIAHAWELTDKHTQQLSGFEESPVRLIDMALWVKRSSA